VSTRVRGELRKTKIESEGFWRCQSEKKKQNLIESIYSGITRSEPNCGKITFFENNFLKNILNRYGGILIFTRVVGQKDEYITNAVGILHRSVFVKTLPLCGRKI
jgi:hypothetical protein